MNSRFTQISAALMMAALSFSVSAQAQDAETPDYYVIAQGPSTEMNSVVDTNGDTRGWWAYSWMNTNVNFTLAGCNPEDLYLEFDFYAELPGKVQGDLVFDGISFGAKIPCTGANDDNQHYFWIKLKSDKPEWTFAQNTQMAAAFDPILSAVKNGEWNHISIPFSNSPALGSLDLTAAYTQIALEFARMRSDKYVFKAKNVALVDKGRYVESEVSPIATPYKFIQPSSDSKECQFVLGGTSKTSAYITLELDHVDVSAYSNVAFNFEVEVTPVDGVEDSKLLENITGAGGQGVILGSKPYKELQDANSWGSEAAGNYAIKRLDWKFGKHVYTVPVNSMNNLNKVNWSDIQTCRMYIYDDVLTLGKINVKFTDFYFSGNAIKSVDGDDDTNGIEEVVLGGDSHVVIYNLSGVQVYAGVLGEAQLPAGLYVVVGEKGSRKVMF